MPLHLFDTQNQDWLDLRLNYITATEAASLFQLGIKSIGKVAEDKLNPVHIEKNEFMIIGNILEDAVIRAFDIRAGIAVQRAHESKIVVLTHPKSRLSATPDGKYVDKSGQFHIVECKTAGSANHDKARENFAKWLTEVPKHYFIQVQTQLTVANTDHALIGCMMAAYPFPLVIYKITKSKLIEKHLLKETDRFWDCLDNDKIFRIDKKKKQDVIDEMPEHQELIFISHQIEV